MRRRELLALLYLAPVAAWAQQRRIYRIGYLGVLAKNPYYDVFVEGLRRARCCCARTM